MTFRPRLMHMTTDMLAAMFQNFRGEYNRQFKFHDARTMHKILSTELSSSTKKETYTMSWLMKGISEWTDMREVSELDFDTYDIINKKWENTLRVLRDDLEDDNTGMIMQRINTLASGAARHKDLRLAELFNAHMAGTVTEFPNGFDGKPLFSTTHAFPDGDFTDSQSNKRSGGSTGVFNDTNLKLAIQSLEEFKFADGNYIGATATDVICGTALKWDARQLVKSGELNLRGTTDGEKGVVNPLFQDNLGVRVLPGISGRTWAVADLSQGLRPFITQTRIPFTFESQTTGDAAFHSDKWDYGIRGRYELGIGPWFYIVGCDNT